MFRQTLFVPSKPEIRAKLTIMTTPQLLAVQNAYQDKINFLARYLRYLRPSAYALCVLLMVNVLLSRRTPRQRAMTMLGGLVLLERCHSRMRSLQRCQEEKLLVDEEVSVREQRRANPK
jgi:hypothetical protein